MNIIRTQGMATTKYNSPKLNSAPNHQIFFSPILSAVYNIYNEKCHTQDMEAKPFLSLFVGER